MRDSVHCVGRVVCESHPSLFTSDQLSTQNLHSEVGEVKGTNSNIIQLHLSYWQLRSKLVPSQCFFPCFRSRQSLLTLPRVPVSSRSNRQTYPLTPSTPGHINRSYCHRDVCSNPSFPSGADVTKPTYLSLSTPSECRHRNAGQGSNTKTCHHQSSTNRRTLPTSQSQLTNIC